jgi:hypothetical protein
MLLNCCLLHASKDANGLFSLQPGSVSLTRAARWRMASARSSRRTMRECCIATGEISYTSRWMRTLTVPPRTKSPSTGWSRVPDDGGNQAVIIGYRMPSSHRVSSECKHIRPWLLVVGEISSSLDQSRPLHERPSPMKE